MDESEAVSRLKQGDVGGLAELVERYQLPALRAAYLITRDRSLAEDVAQTAFLRAYDRIDQFDAARPFGPWFLRSVVNDAVKVARRRGRSVALEAFCPDRDSAPADWLVDPTPGPADLADQSETSETVWGALARLTPQQRAVIVLRYFLELSEADMAEQLVVPRGTVKRRLHTARERLRALLGPWLMVSRSASRGAE
jgi:RNA polymerase sigma-70 factor (ECF subfamily)